MTAQFQIEQLVRAKLLGKNISPVSLIDELLVLAASEGEIHCSKVSNETLRFTLPTSQVTFDVSVDAAIGKLRMMCARLGVLCTESGGTDVQLYGGEGLIAESQLLNRTSLEPALSQSINRPAGEMGAIETVRTSKSQWKVRFKNTMQEQEFIIQAT